MMHDDSPAINPIIGAFIACAFSGCLIGASLGFALAWWLL
jgi:hypothetical protein